MHNILVNVERGIEPHWLCLGKRVGSCDVDCSLFIVYSALYVQSCDAEYMQVDISVGSGNFVHAACEDKNERKV
jgi:hypothetical protein